MAEATEMAITFEDGLAPYTALVVDALVLTTVPLGMILALCVLIPAIGGTKVFIGHLLANFCVISIEPITADEAGEILTILAFACW